MNHADPQIARLVELVCLRAAEGLDHDDARELRVLLLQHPEFEPRCYEEVLAAIYFEAPSPPLHAPPPHLLRRLRAAAENEAFGPPNLAPPAADVLESLLAAPDLQTLPLQPSGDPASRAASGDVLWSDGLSRGLLRLRDLPPNDRAALQYQLWIFDAQRDPAHPVDAGVFDIPVASGEHCIQIQPRLPVRRAAMFAITAEQPGGEVVSQRDRLLLTTRTGE